MDIQFDTITRHWKMRAGKWWTLLVGNYFKEGDPDAYVPLLGEGPLPFTPRSPRRTPDTSPIAPD